MEEHPEPAATIVDRIGDDGGETECLGGPKQRTKKITNPLEDNGPGWGRDRWGRSGKSWHRQAAATSGVSLCPAQLAVGARKGRWRHLGVYRIRSEGATG